MLRTSKKKLKSSSKLKIKNKEEIRSLNERKQDIYSECGKIDDMLEIHSKNKSFIKTIADFAKIKTDNKNTVDDDKSEGELSESEKSSTKVMPKFLNDIKIPK